MVDVVHLDHRQCTSANQGRSEWLETEDDGRGYGPLREAIADYLGTSRGVRCYPDQIAIVNRV